MKCYSGQRVHGSDLLLTRHEGEPARQLHDPRGGAGGLEDGAVGADVAAG